MTMYSFGASTNDYIEVRDTTYVPPDELAGSVLMVRPPAGTAFLLRDSATQEFPSVVTDPVGTTLTSDEMDCLASGYLAFSASSPVVEVSADGGTKWKTLYGTEAVSGAITAGVDVTALTARVTDLELNGGGGGGGGTGYAAATPGVILTWPLPQDAGQLLPRPTARTDVIVEWSLPDPPPEGGGYFFPDIDRFLDTSP